MQTSPSAREGGISLPDVLVAIAIFAIAFLSLIALYPIGQRSVEQAQALNAATFLAEEILQSEMSLEFDQIQNRGPAPVESDRLQAVNRHGQQEAIRYRYQVLVTPLVDAVAAPAKNLVVLVTWTHGEVLRAVRLETEVAKL